MSSFDREVDSESVQYEPVGVKDVLVEMKDTSELLVDLAYSGVLHNDENLAREVLALESKMDLLQIQARMSLLLAARNPSDAKQLASVLGVVSAAEKISDAAGDIANIVIGDIGLPDAIRAALPEAMEVLVWATVAEESPYAGRTLGEIDLETETGVHVIARRRDDDWILNPDEHTKLVPADVLLLRGAEQTVTDVYETVTGTAYERPDEFEHTIADLERAVDAIVLMKNVSELAVDLAYGSVLFDNEELAEEVHSLEVEIDALQERLEAWALQAATQVEDPVSLRGLIHLASSTEIISDAALEITEGILRDIDTHPVIAESIQESDVVIGRFRVDPESRFAERTIGAVADAQAGLTIIAVHRDDDEWIFYPDEAVRIETGDVLIARGTWRAIESFDEASASE